MQVISINNQYSSGKRRLAAWLTDRIILSIILSALVFPWWGFPVHMDGDFFSIGLRFWGMNVFREAIIILYNAFLESSKYQASLGKIALGIKVVDDKNQRLSFSKALLRNLSKLLSGFILGIGYIMIIFDERKQGLHDKIADTFVVTQ